MAITYSNRILATPSAYAREHYLYVQETGTLTSLIPHISQRKNLDSLLFFVVLEGAGSLVREGIRYSLSAGDCVWLDCSRPYAHESSEELPWTLAWVHFFGREARSFYKDYTAKGKPFLFRPGNIYPFTNTLTLLFREQSRKDTLSELTSHKYLTDIITSIYLENDKKEVAQTSIPDKFLKIRNYLDSHLSDKVNLDTIAEHFFISKYHLAREYKKIFGSTIGEDLQMQRISKAKTLLRFSDKTLEEVAGECGFQDVGYFIKVFKKEEGVTPRSYRLLW